MDYSRFGAANPGLTSWGILSRPFGTGRWEMCTQDYVLGYSQPCLTGLNLGRSCSRNLVSPLWEPENRPRIGPRPVGPVAKLQPSPGGLGHRFRNIVRAPEARHPECR